MGDVGNKRERENDNLTDDEVVEVVKANEMTDEEISKRRTQFTTYVKKNPWIKSSGYLPAPKGQPQKSYEDVWIQDRKLHCTLCQVPINIGNNTGNISKHAGNESHKSKVDTNQIALNHYAAPLPPKPKALSPEERTRKEKCVSYLRAVTHALTIAHGMNPTEMTKVMGPKTLIKESIKALEAESMEFATSPQTITRDFALAEDLLDKAITSLIGTDPIAVGVDGTSMRDSKVQLVLIHTLRSKPLLVDLIWPEDDPDFSKKPVYDYVKAAPDILKTLEKYGVPQKDFPNRVTCLVADNTASQPRLAKELQVAHGKCGAHCVNLVALALKSLPDFTDLVIGLGSLIYLGGGIKRKVSLKENDLQPRSIQTHAGRFGTTVSAAKYDLDNFDSIKKCVNEWVQVQRKKKYKRGEDNDEEDNDEDEEHMGGGDGEEEEDDNDDDDDDLVDDDGDTLKAKISKKLDGVSKAWNKKTARVTLHIVDILFRDLPDLVKDLSGEGDSVPPGIFEKLEMFEEVFAAAVNDPASVSAPALSKSLLSVSPSELNVINKNIKNVAEIALAKLRKHIPPFKALLKHRFLYSPRRMPEALPTDLKIDRKQFLGCLHYDVRMGAQYSRYVEEVKALHDRNEASTIDTYQFWNSKRVCWPDLTPLALYHLTFPVGNISAERGCGQLRHIESDWNRVQQEHVTIRREVKFKYNKDILEGLAKDLKKELSNW